MLSDQLALKYQRLRWIRSNDEIYFRDFATSSGIMARSGFLAK